MKKISRILTMCLITLALLCTAVPAAFAAEEQQEQNVYAIGLDASGGASSTVVVYTALNGKLPSLPEQPTMDGYTFQGWYTEPVGGTKVTTSTVFTSDTTIYAHWTVKSGAGTGTTVPSQPAQDTASFDLNEHRGSLLVAGIVLVTIVAAAI